VNSTLVVLSIFAFVGAFVVVGRTPVSRYRTFRYEATVLGLMLAGIGLVVTANVVDR
jgi:hypothetical protein